MAFDPTMGALSLVMVGLKLTLACCLAAEGDTLGASVVAALSPFTMLWAFQPR